MRQTADSSTEVADSAGGENFLTRSPFVEPYSDSPEPPDGTKTTRQSGRGQGRTLIVARVLPSWWKMVWHAVSGTAIAHSLKLTIRMSSVESASADGWANLQSAIDNLQSAMPRGMSQGFPE